jgi:hypothetical protein
MSACRAKNGAREGIGWIAAPRWTNVLSPERTI